MQSMPPPGGFARAVIASMPEHFGRLSSGDGPRPQDRSRKMSFADAHAFAFSLAATLMVSIVIFRAGDGTMSVMPTAEYDGDDDTIVEEIDPFA